MGASDVCQMEDAIQALLEYLVDPSLPAKSSARDNPSESQQQSVAQQVHAVLLLYNYYHRKQHPHLKYCDFEWFCKLAVVNRPALLAYLNLMPISDDTKLDDPVKQHSVTEKRIMDACDISTSLYALKGVPCTDWPISKVTVLLIDSLRENCLLQFSSITKGVWSVIEKDLDAANHSSEGMKSAKQLNKRKNILKKSSTDELSFDEADFQQLAFSAVEEATKISQTHLMILEGHVTYSLSVEKSATCFYIMQCTSSKYDDIFQVPIKDVIASLQGPLLLKDSLVWTVTPVVEYFHMLPYAGILSDWQSGLVSSNCFHSEVGLGKVNINDYKRTEKIHNIEVQKDTDGFTRDSVMIAALDNKTVCAHADSPKKKDNHSDCMNDCFDAFDASDCMDLDATTVGANAKARMVNSAVGSPVTESRGEKVAVGYKICHINSSSQVGTPKVDSAPVSHQSNPKDPDKQQTIQVSKENILSQTALKVLLRRRDTLSLELRSIEDEIAQCDRNIQRILNGSEDDFALKIESIIEGCTGGCLRNGIQERTYEHNEGLPHSIKRKRLSEAVLSMQNPCLASKELDGICYENNWILPTYRVSFSHGGFQAKVSVKGIDFECSSEGCLRSSTREARESAAAEMLVKLRSMATTSI